MRQSLLQWFFSPRSWVDTLAFPIINSMHTNTFIRMPAVNMLNCGAIANLPADIFVEGPASVDASGVRLLSIGNLPKPLAAFCRRDIDLMEMTVEVIVLIPCTSAQGGLSMQQIYALKAQAGSVPTFDVEGYIDGELVGGIELQFADALAGRTIYMPVILQRYQE